MRRKKCSLLASALLIGSFLVACADQTPTSTDRLSSAIRSTGDDSGKFMEKYLPPGMVIPEPRISKTEAPSRDLAGTPPIWESDYGTGLNQSDDDCDLRSIGFTFTFYGVEYTEVWVNSNGNLTFNGCNRAWWHPDVPDGANVLVAPLYGDFNPWGGGDVYVNTIGTEPNRRFVVTWVDVPEFGAPSSEGNTFQVQLIERRNIIVFGYKGLSTDGINWAYGSPSTDANMDVGISSGTGYYINSASGSEIPALDMNNIAYVPRGRRRYVEFKGQDAVSALMGSAVAAVGIH
jgi:hypothetical protein